LPRRPLRYLLPYRPLRAFFTFWLSVVAADRDRSRALRRLLDLHDRTFFRVDRAAIAYDGGVHVKHRLTRYHDFFVERIRSGERVLDVGCGVGALANDLAVKANAVVVGIDNNQRLLADARKRYEHPRLIFVEADAVRYAPAEKFDVVVLSNVLEHVEERVELLRLLRERSGAGRFLLRVPVWARHWMVPLKKELGLPYFSDPGHFIEYDADSLRDELTEAGLKIYELQAAWGELWVEARPSAREPQAHGRGRDAR
jgi:SAM-dependent methyltransferase